MRHGRSCRLCSANGNITEGEVDSDKCPIKAFLKEQRQTGKQGLNGKLAKKEEGSDDAGEEDIVMPGEVKDEEEEEGKPPVAGLAPEQVFDQVKGHT